MLNSVVRRSRSIVLVPRGIGSSSSQILPSKTGQILRDDSRRATAMKLSQPRGSTTSSASSTVKLTSTTSIG
ncbi:TPA: hypothetical protein N0F65_003594 [Lagenidium giganteum]|uniref:Uncharacterized protein n=1 Tax=Lagenidium giganteum TaxID=4803 RepID=A0AAV2Z7P3_9STRA|nr:TPA: hypothetical protein N0F65_003594 [Lagenidium giganteum]